MKATTETTTIETTIITLELDQYEAQFLMDVMQFIGGSEHNTRRKYACALQVALKEVGVRTVHPVKDIAGKPGSCGINFE